LSVLIRSLTGICTLKTEQREEEKKQGNRG